MTGPSGAERPLVVGVDASVSARHAALWAVDLAAARGSGVDLVHVVAGRPRTVPDWLTEIADSADRAGAVPCRVDVVTGAVFDALLTRSHAANMIIVGSFGPDAPAGMLVGSTALTLIARAGCPVAVIRGARRGLPPPRGGPILAGADGTPPPTTPSMWRLISRHRWAPRWFPCTPGLEPGPAPQTAYTARQEAAPGQPTRRRKTWMNSSAVSATAGPTSPWSGS